MDEYESSFFLAQNLLALVAFEINVSSFQDQASQGSATWPYVSNVSSFQEAISEVNKTNSNDP